MFNICLAKLSKTVAKISTTDAKANISKHANIIKTLAYCLSAVLYLGFSTGVLLLHLGVENMLKFK